MGFFKKIIDGLKKTQQNIGFQIKKLFKVGIFNDDFTRISKKFCLQATWVRKPRRKLLTI